ncbi:DUF6522 family protein [Methylobacterium sp. E-066]|uniref:DUF6522 family protein n=1 Tax=Methylobacterium sp. E-066 TaxID=2836584 RepID=UPI001FB89452|nr:DUF6522 family protein [Methylobacterium sp. E-066]MCJ2142102.1 DUF6522 family protein [Methylobacterium sp. E-066]
MRLDLDEDGGWLITPAELAHKFGLEEWVLRRQAALGCVESRIARGYGRYKGRSRVTIIVGKLGWQGTFAASGELLTEFRWEPQPVTIKKSKALISI